MSQDTPPPGASGPARGRRSNGLPAAEWGALVDVDPRLSEQLLDGLAAAGVAAWAEPAGATTDPVSRAGTLPGRPLDRLWVDVARAADARGVVERAAEQLISRLETPPGERPAGVEQFLHAVPRGASGRVLDPPGTLLRRIPPATPSQPDTDAAWRQIVEDFERTAESPVPPWPAAEDLPAGPAQGAGAGSAPPAEGPPRRRRSDRAEARDDAALPGWVEPEPVPDEGHFEPSPAPPSPRVRPRTVAAAAALVLGLILLLTPSVLGQAPGAASFLFGAVLAAGGVAALVHGMRDTPAADGGPDDGAVV